MEFTPNPENKIEKETVLEMLRINGFDHPETKELVMKWTEQKEAQVTTSHDAIVFNIERTDLYLAVGDKKGAIENLEDALTQTDQEKEKKLQDQIIAKIKELKVPQFDVIPEGTFRGISREEASAIIFSIKIGREIQVEYPTVADDYRAGLSLNDIIKKYNLTEIYRIKTKTAETAVRYALGGYDGKIEFVTDEKAYTGLIENKDELKKIAHEHNVSTGRDTGTQMKNEKKGIYAMTEAQKSEVGRKSGLAQFQKGIGIHAQTPEERKEVLKLAQKALGNTIFSNEEIDFIKEKITEPEYQRKSRINAKKLAELLNQKFHGGNNVRTPRSIIKINFRLKSGERR